MKSLFSRPFGDIFRPSLSKNNLNQCEPETLCHLFNEPFLPFSSLQTPPNITVTTASPQTTVTNNNTPPPPTSIGKNLSGPFIKKDRRQISSRFNINKQNCEIETLPPLKGKFTCPDRISIFGTQKKNNLRA